MKAVLPVFFRRHWLGGANYFLGLVRALREHPDASGGTVLVLSNDPDDKGATRAIVDGARSAAGASAPFGMDPGWWDGVVARAGALADLVESPSADPEHVVELASAVRAELRPYI